MHVHTIQLNIEKTMGGTAHMDATEFGAYMSLIICAYRKKNMLPDEDKRLARMAKCSPRVWSRIRDTISEKFIIKDGYWTNFSVGEQLVKYQTLSEKNRANALGNNNTPEPVAKPNESQTAANISNNKPVTNNNKEKEESMYVISSAVENYNALADEIGLPRMQKLSSTRKQKLKARLKDCGGIEGWDAALCKLKESSFCRGEKTNWKADFDFLISESKFIKLMEGGYDDARKLTEKDRIGREAQELMESFR